jgi:hypothetical protein
MIEYPSSLPAATAGTLSESSLDPWVDDAGAVGAPRRRKRFTRSLRRWSFSLLLSTDELNTLRTFYVTTLDDGVMEFAWTHPTSAEVFTVRFGGYPKMKHQTGDLWGTDIDLVEI